MNTRLTANILLGWVTLTGGIAAAADLRFENEHVVVQATARTADQMAAFYEGRGFPKSMIDWVRTRCFVTIGIRNKSTQVVWLDMASWTFGNDAKPVKRIPRAQWFEEWARMDMPMSARSTFRWTLMPEVLDFQPGESAAGNMTFETSSQPFDVTMPFEFGPQEARQRFVATLKGVRCGQE